MDPQKITQKYPQKNHTDCEGHTAGCCWLQKFSISGCVDRQDYGYVATGR